MRRHRVSRVLPALVVAVALLGACGGSGHGSASADHAVPAAVGSGGRPTGFATTTVVIRRADGTLCTLCVYLAERVSDQMRGLMNVTDLAGRDGMLFRFSPPSTERFWMRNTIIPLTAVWFAANGFFLERADMTPCPDAAPTCDLYGPVAPAADTIEFPVGRADALGIGAGSQLVSRGKPSAIGAAADPGVCPLLLGS
jgi:uncharacterized membrane protein (UPF0127 family)